MEADLDCQQLKTLNGIELLFRNRLTMTYQHVKTNQLVEAKKIRNTIGTFYILDDKKQRVAEWNKYHQSLIDQVIIYKLSNLKALDNTRKQTLF